MESINDREDYYYQKGYDDGKKLYEEKCNKFDELKAIVDGLYFEDVDSDGDLNDIGVAVVIYLGYL